MTTTRCAARAAATAAGATALAAMPLLLAAAASAAGTEPSPIGHLVTNVPVTVRSDTSYSTLPPSSYVYFGGDTVATPGVDDARAALSVRDGAVVLGPDSTASVRQEADHVAVAVDRGKVRTRFGPDGRFVIEAAEMGIRPAETPAKDGVDATIIARGNQVTVVSHRGELVAAPSAGGPGQTIETGQKKTFAISAGGLELVDSGGGGLWGIKGLTPARAGWVAGGAAVLGGGGAALGTTLGGGGGGDDAALTSATTSPTTSAD